MEHLFSSTVKEKIELKRKKWKKVLNQVTVSLVCAAFIRCSSSDPYSELRNPLEGTIYKNDQIKLMEPISFSRRKRTPNQKLLRLLALADAS